MAEQKTVTISPPGAAAAGCRATCEVFSHDYGTRYHFDYYQFAATAALGWALDHFEFHQTIDSRYPVDQNLTTPSGVNPYPANAASISGDPIAMALCEGYDDYPITGHEVFTISELVAVFRQTIVQRPFLVYADQAGKLVRTDAGSLMNGM